MRQVETISATKELYSNHVNPQWVRLLDLLQMNVRYTRCLGVELFASDGRGFLDFLSGYCIHNIGHNHPSVVAALREELARSGPSLWNRVQVSTAAQPENSI